MEEVNNLKVAPLLGKTKQKAEKGELLFRVLSHLARILGLGTQ